MRHGEYGRMNAECGGYYSQVVAQKRGNAQPVKRGNFGGKEEMEIEKQPRKIIAAVPGWVIF
jgi:hypothetical protein